MRRRRPQVRCPRCGNSCRSSSWVCEACLAERQVEALVDVLTDLARQVVRGICPVDGCLLVGVEDCPACTVRNPSTTTQEDEKCPTRWVRRGLIWHPVYDQSEVA